MALFAYRAHGIDGTLRTGEIAADSQAAALAQIRGQGLFVSGLVEKTAAARPWEAWQVLWRRHQFARHEALFVRQLAVLLRSGLTLYDSLVALSGGASGSTHALLIKLQGEIAAGRPFSETLRQTGLFQPLTAAIVQVGEESGDLPQMLERLAVWLERREQSREKLKTVLAYPLFLLLETLGIGTFLLLFVLPAFADLFLSMGAELPLPTRLLLGLSSLLLENAGLLLGGLLLGSLVTLALLRRGYGREWLARWRLRGPVFGRLRRETAWLQILRALSVLLSCGISLDAALRKAKSVADSVYLTRVLSNLSQGTLQGFALSEQLRREPTFPAVLLELLRAGEAAGCQAEMLGHGADYLAMRVENQAARLQALAEPCAYLVIFVLVGGIVAAVALPWLEMMTLLV